VNGDDRNGDDRNGDDLFDDGPSEVIGDEGRPDEDRRDRRPYLIALGIGLASGVLGLRWGDALLVGLVAGVVGVGVLAAGAGRSYGWPAERQVEASGARREISALTWTFIGLDGRVTEAAVRRLRADATRRLAQRGIVIPGGLGATTATSPDIDEEVRARARDALGERAWAILVRPGGTMPSLVDVAHCVDVVERLAADQPETPAPPSRRG
jgi:hypothetical protein